MDVRMFHGLTCRLPVIQPHIEAVRIEPWLKLNPYPGHETPYVRLNVGTEPPRQSRRHTCVSQSTLTHS